MIEVFDLLFVAFKSLSLLSFDLLFVAFDSSSFSCDSGADVIVEVVEVDVVALELDIVCGVGIPKMCGVVL